VTGPSAKVFVYQAVQEPEQQDQDYRRDIDAAEIREDTPYRPEQWLRYPPQKIPDRRDYTIVSVDNPKSDKPAQNRLRDQQPNVDLDYDMDETEEGIHLAGDPGGERRADPSVSGLAPQGLADRAAGTLP
jgi:hypothetical protein